MIIKNTWRTQKITLAAGIVKEVIFTDTSPNVAQFRNNGTVGVFMNSDSPLFDLENNNFEFAISAGATRNYVNPEGFHKLFLYADSATTILINTAEDNEIRSYDLDETTITQLNTVNVPPSVQVTAILSKLPEGTNTIGGVDIVSLPVLPAGTNTIGGVDIVSFPSDVITKIDTIISLLTDIKTNTTPTP